MEDCPDAFCVINCTFRRGAHLLPKPVSYFKFFAPYNPSNPRINMPPTITLPSFSGVIFAARRPPKKGKLKNAKLPEATPKLSNTIGFDTSKKEPLWRCVEGCGACCKLAKGPAFATPEEIFTNPSDIELYKSLIGPDGWCIHYEKSTRKCSIYPDRPYFCRVEPDIFESLYGITKKKFNKVACGSCRDTIKEIYGSHSKELDNFNRSLRSSD